MLSASSEGVRFAPLPRFPLVERDLAVVTKESTEAETLRQAILRSGSDVMIENVTLFDSYKGPGILPGMKSLAFRFSLRSDDHTLSDEEIKSAMDSIIRSLGDAGAALRA